jgi:hypothetical protein
MNHREVHVGRAGVVVVAARARRRGLLLAVTCMLLLCALATPVPAQGTPALVQVQMRNVSFRLDSTVVLDIQHLRGQLRRRTDESPLLDDKRSFTLAIDSARIGITPAALSDLLNRYTFAYPGAPLRRLRVTIEQGKLKQEGRLHGVSFTVLDDLSLTPEGDLRLHPTSIKAVGIKVGGLMKFFGLHLQKLVNTERARGVRVEKDDFVLSPTRLLPPPEVEGKVGAVRITDQEIVQDFVPAEGKPAPPLRLPRPEPRNYMFFREGTLRFGKLTMRDTDLLIEDAEPADPFDFWLDHYNQQLVGGWSRNTLDHGLIVTMPDYAALHRTGPARRAPAVRARPP